jgi:calcineurin-like phosphoesterase family protein
MKRFIISDMHFGHKNIIKYENRPFASVGEMDDLIIQKWNNSVKNDDIIFVLGDVSFYNQEKQKKLSLH